MRTKSEKRHFVRLRYELPFVIEECGTGVHYHQPMTYREFPRPFQVIQGGGKDPIKPKK